MVDLSASRILPIFPFIVIGIDFVGKFSQNLAFVGGSSLTKKHTVASFVYFSSRAIYLDTVSTLSTSAVLTALKCFMVARSGAPTTTISTTVLISLQ